MINQTFTTRRSAGQLNMQALGPNQNVVRHLPKSLGSFSQTIVVGLLVLIVGLIYVTQGTKAASYDYELSNLDKEIAEMTAKREDLVAEQARLTAVKASEKSAVAAAMKEAR